MPALPLGEAGTYVAAAYIVFVALVCIYVTIIGRKITRAQRRLDQLSERSHDPRR